MKLNFINALRALLPGSPKRNIDASQPIIQNEAYNPNDLEDPIEKDVPWHSAEVQESTFRQDKISDEEKIPRGIIDHQPKSIFSPPNSCVMCKTEREDEHISNLAALNTLTNTLTNKYENMLLHAPDEWKSIIQSSLENTLNELRAAYQFVEGALELDYAPKETRAAQKRAAQNRFDQVQEQQLEKADRLSKVITLDYSITQKFQDAALNLSRTPADHKTVIKLVQEFLESKDDNNTLESNDDNNEQLKVIYEKINLLKETELNLRKSLKALYDTNDSATANQISNEICKKLSNSEPQHDLKIPHPHLQELSSRNDKLINDLFDKTIAQDVLHDYENTASDNDLINFMDDEVESINRLAIKLDSNAAFFTGPSLWLNSATDAEPLMQSYQGSLEGMPDITFLKDLPEDQTPTPAPSLVSPSLVRNRWGFPSSEQERNQVRSMQLKARIAVLSNQILATEIDSGIGGSEFSD